jgi:hypothetical protein
MSLAEVRSEGIANISHDQDIGRALNKRGHVETVKRHLLRLGCGQVVGFLGEGLHA